MEKIQNNLENDQKKRNRSVIFTKFVMDREEAPYDFVITIEIDKNPNSLSKENICDQIK